MKSLSKIITILLLSVGIFLGLSSYKEDGVYAISCPPKMNPDSMECLNYLKDQLEKLQKQQSSISKQLSSEEYQQLSLQGKISYITNQVAQTEKLIKTLEVEVAASDVSIKLLEVNITEKEDYISLLRQEADILQKTVTQRITESYKYSFVGAFEIFLDVKNFSSAIRRTKYLITTRSQDIKSLEEYAKKIETLKEEEEELSKQKAELQIQRNRREEEKLQLADERETLVSQKAEKTRLLAESKAKEEALLQALRKNKDLQKKLDAEILAYINTHMTSIVKSGPVYKGDRIGYVYPSSSRCSTGPHVHFGIDNSSSGYFSNDVKPFPTFLTWGAGSGIKGWDGWNYPYVYSNNYQLPIAGSVIMTQDYHSGYAIDLCKPGGCANAPVIAVDNGTLWRGVDNCGQNYAIIVHNKTSSYKYGYRTIYVHLK
jgi:hypothetical protein